MSGYDEFGLLEKDGWSDDEIVGAYIDRFGPITDLVGDTIVQDHIAAGDDVLDLCCGQGTLTAALTNAAANTVGLDFSPEMVAIARTKAPDAEIVEGDAMAMPFETGQFDKVVCNFGIMHIPDQPKALAEIRRVLKPGGEFIMATWMAPNTSPAFAAVFGALKTFADFSAAPPQPDLFTFADPEQAKAMMDLVGLDFVKRDVVETEWVLNKPTELFDIFLSATVGAGMLIRSQTSETIGKIAGAIETTVREQHADGSVYRVPVTVAVNSARPV